MEHDFENIQRGARAVSAGKTRITIYLDDDVLKHFRETATQRGRGYQTEINATLRNVMENSRVAYFRNMRGFSSVSEFRVGGGDYNYFYMSTRDKKYHEYVTHDITRRTKTANPFSHYQARANGIFKLGMEA